MLESKQNQPKLESNQDKYLIINSEVVLDAIVTSRVRIEEDLVLGQLEEGIFSILKDGKRIVERLHKLTTELGYVLILYSNRKEHQIIHVLEELDKACKRDSLNGFPKINTIIVKDRDAYQNVGASNPNVAEGHLHGILVASYSLQSQQETEILNGCSKLLHFSKSEQKSYIVLDNRSSFIEKTKEEGWNIYDTSSTSFNRILYDLCQKSAAPNNQNIQENLEDHTEEKKNSSSPSKTFDSRLKNSIYSKHEAEKINLVKKSSDTIVKPTANEIGPSLDSLKPCGRDSQKLFQMNATMEVDKIEKEETDRNELEELKDLLPPSLLPSDFKFKMVKGPKIGGSSAILRWFVEEATNSTWVGKCSYSELHNKDHFYEYKEHLGSLIYRLYGVKTPKTVFSKQLLDEEFQRDNSTRVSDISTHRFHLMSSFVPGFELLGDQFIEDYKASSRRNKKQLFCLKGGNRPLIGFGKVVAVSILIHDYDFVGNAGKNIGCIPSENGEYLEIIKIDPGESLSFAEDMSTAPSLDNPPSRKVALAGTSGQRIEFDDLNEYDQRECIETLKEMLTVKVSTLQKLFAPFLDVDIKFRIIFEEFLNRRKELLVTFCGEVGSLIERYIRELEEQQAVEQMSKWGRSPLLMPLQRKKKGQLIKDKAQLEAFTAAADTNTTDAKILKAAPYRKVTFVGREAELSQLKKLFRGSNGIIGCAIVGGPGLGKSQLATEYIIRNQREMYSEVVWLHAEQSDLIVDQMQIYLETCYKVKFDPQEKDKKTAIITRFYRILEKEEDGMNKSSKKSCIVFDNADSMAQIADYLPDNKTYPKLKIDIIVTSRFKKWDEPVGAIIEMQAFDKEETKNYIKSYFSISRVETDDNQLSVDAEKLNELVGGLPIALSLAVAYIQQKGLAISDFCNFVAQENNKEFIPLQNKGVSKKAETFREDKDELKSMNIVSTVLTLALTDLRRKNHSVESILNIIAYLSPDDIQTNLLADCWSQCQKHGSLIGPNLSKRMEFSLENTSSQLAHENLMELSVVEKNHETKSFKVGIEDFNEALELMLSYSLVSFNPANLVRNQIESEENVPIGGIDSKNIRVHRLTQQVIRLNHQKSYIYDRIYGNVFEWIVDGLVYDDKEIKDVQRAAFLIPHGIYLESLQNNINTYKMAELQELMGEHQLNGVGNYRVALIYYQKALEIKTIYYGKDHPHTGITLENLGNLWGRLGEYQKQKDLLTRALVINEKHYGKDHPKTGTTLGNLGVLWGSLGDYEKQKDLLTRALAIEEKHYDKGHPETASTLTNLSNAWGSLGDYEKQKDLLTRALVINEKHYGKDHPKTGTTLGNLGIVWGDLGDDEKKRDLLTRALEIFEKHYGKDHPETGNAFGSLGNVWGSLGDYEKQKDLLTRALEIFEKHYGKDHPQTAIKLRNLGNTWGDLGDYEKQKDLLTRALLINQTHYGKDHPQTGITLTDLGNAWGSLGDYEKQKDLLTRALVITEKHYGKDHPQTGIALGGLGNAWGSLGDYEKKKDLLIRALAIEERHYGKDHPKTVITLTNLGNAWGDLDNYEKHKDLLTRALEISEKHFGKDHPQTGIVLGSLGNAWGSLGDYEKQKDLLTQALLINETHNRKDHPQTGLILAHLGNAWGYLGNYEKKIDLLNKALEIFDKQSSKNHPQISITLTNLGDAWGSLGDYEKQKDLLTLALAIKEKHYGKDHPSTETTLTNLGNVWGDLGDYEKQKDLLTRALVIIEKHYGKDHPQTGITLTNLGSAWGSLGDYEKQKDLLTRALVIYEKHYGKDHPSTGTTLGNLSNAWGYLGDYEKQKDLLTRALEIFEKNYGKDHPNIGSTLGNLSNAWGYLGNYEKQKDLLTRALEIFEKNYGKDHPSIGTTLENLGNVWGNLGDYEKQRDLLTRALVIEEKHYGKDHPQTARTLTNLSNAWGSLGDYEKQKDLLTRALVIFEKHFGKDHPSTGTTLGNLGNAWGSLGEYEKQRDLLTRALVITEKHYGKDHPQTGIRLANLGSAWGSLGDYEKQKDLLTRALVIDEKHYGKDHPQTGTTIGNLGNAWGSLGDYEKQKDLLTRALVIKENHYGKDHPETGATLGNLGNALGPLGEYEKQRDLLTRALVITEKHYGKDHPQTGITLANLGNAWGSLGDYEKQKDLLTRALVIKEKHYGKDHASTGTTLANLGNAWGDLGDYEKQKDLLTRALNIFECNYSPTHPHIHKIKATLANLSL